MTTENETALVIATPPANGQTSDNRIRITRGDLLARKDGGERITPAEVDAIFAEHGHKQAR